MSISVIIPCFNCASTIEGCLNSVLNQTYPISEIILIDDCSSDDTPEVISRLVKDNRTSNITYLKTSRNFGPGYARNVGLETSKSDFVAFLDSDDFWEPTKCEICVGFFDKNPYASMVAHPRVMFDKRKSDECQPDILYQTELISLKSLYLSNIIPTSSVVVKRDLLSLHKFYDRNYTEDYLLWLELIENGAKVFFIKSPLSYTLRPQHIPGGYSGALYRHELREINAILTFCRKNNKGIVTSLLLTGWSLIKYFRRVILRYLNAFKF